MTSDMMGDAMDDMAGEDGEEEETDELVGQVLDEIGVSLGQDLVAAPGVKTAAAVRAPAAAEPAAEAVGAGGGSAPPPPPRAAAPPPRPPPAAASGSGAAAPPPPPPAEGPGLDDDLQARLDALRKG